MLEMLVPLLSLVFPHRLILFQHAPSGADGCNNDYRDRSDEAGKEKIFESRQEIMDQEIHEANCSPADSGIKALSQQTMSLLSLRDVNPSGFQGSLEPWPPVGDFGFFGFAKIPIVRNIPTRAWLLAVASSILQILVFPKLGLYFLSWVAVAPLLYALLRGRGGEGELVDSEGRSLRPFTLWQGFVLGWVCGFIWYLGTCYWIYPVMHDFGNLNMTISALLMLGLSGYMALNHGLFCALVVLMARRSSLGNRRPLFLAPFFWVAIELFRDRVIGFPWNPLGGSQVDNIPFARIGEVTGVYGLSFAVMLVNCAFVAGLLLFGRRRTNLLISAAAAAIALQMGVFAKPDAFPAGKEAILVQENVPVLDPAQWTPQYFDHTVGELAQLSVSTHKQSQSERRGPQAPGTEDPGLIVWPESPAFFYTTDPRLLAWLTTIAQDTRSYLIVGSVGVQDSPQGVPVPFNSAMVVDPQGHGAGRYDKIHLVPFGEFVPFKDLLVFAQKLTREVGDLGRGTERKVFDLNGTRVGVFICYESVFPDEVRQFAGNGAQVLINISNDGWYGDTSAPYQHLQMARMRAIENHRWMLVDTNSGITSAIDPFGRVIVQAPRNVRTAIRVPYSPLIETTFYMRDGDIFAWLCVVISVLAVIVRARIPGRTMIEVRPV
jgi:apolipoprotein N-acyltransferase